MSVPLARRNLLANTPRLIRSVSGIAFAVLLMIVELGFRDGFLESMVMNLRALDGDIMLISSAKYQVDRISPFSRRQLYQARAVPGAGPDARRGRGHVCCGSVRARAACARSQGCRVGVLWFFGGLSDSARAAECERAWVRGRRALLSF